MLMRWPNLSQCRINERTLCTVTTVGSTTRPKFESQFTHLHIRCSNESISCLKSTFPYSYFSSASRRIKWDSIIEDAHFLLQGIFPNQGSNPSLPHCRQTLYPLSIRKAQKMPRRRLKTLRCYLILVKLFLFVCFSIEMLVDYCASL